MKIGTVMSWWWYVLMLSNRQLRMQFGILIPDLISKYSWDFSFVNGSDKQILIFYQNNQYIAYKKGKKCFNSWGIIK